jgi:hypothetical protein
MPLPKAIPVACFPSGCQQGSDASAHIQQAGWWRQMFCYLCNKGTKHAEKIIPVSDILIFEGKIVIAFI